MRTSLLRPLLSVLIVLMLAGCSLMRLQGAEPPRVTLASLTPVKLSLFEQRFEVGLRLQNPNAFTLPIQALDYTLAINGEDFASGMSRTDLQVPAFGEELVTVTVTSDLLNSLDQIRRWQQGPPEALDYRLSGRAHIADMPVRLPFEYAGSVNLGASPD